MMHCTVGDVRDEIHRRVLPTVRWGRQYRFFRDEVIVAMTRVENSAPDPGGEKPAGRHLPGRDTTGGEIDNDRRYPEVPQ